MNRPVVIHVDGGKGVGLGHITRGLGLAYALRQRDRRPVFLVDSNSGTRPFIQDRGYECLDCSPTPERLTAICENLSAEILIVDSYRISSEDFTAFSDKGLRIVCFDDVAERDLQVAMVINGSPAALELTYRVGKDTKLLLGPKYQIVRPEFVSETNRTYPKIVSHVFVSIGGDDPRGVFDELVSFFQSRVLPIMSEVEIHFVIGPLFKSGKVSGAPKNFYFHSNPENMPRLMMRADLAISAGGQTLYELARCATPTVAFGVGEDQILNLHSLSKLGLADFIGFAGEKNWLRNLETSFFRLANDSRLRAVMGEKAARLIDGQGAYRIVDAVKELDISHKDRVI